MNNLHEKLNRETDHIRLSHAEKNAMRAAIFGLSGQGAPSPMRVERTPYAFLSQPWMRAFAAVLVVIFAGGGTAFASQGALPGQPLYAIKTNVVEPVKVALASSPAAKAAVHAQIAAERVAEAETLAQKGTLDATTSAELAANFESHAESAVMLADAASSTDPAAAVQVRAQLAADSSVGSAVLVALADHESDRSHVDAFAARMLAVNLGTSEEERGNSRSGAAVQVRAFAQKAPEPTASPAAGVRTMAAMTATSAANGEATDTAAATGGEPQAKMAAFSPGQEKAAAQLELRAQSAIESLRAQFSTASSTLDASTTVRIQTDLSGIDGLMQDGTQALNDSVFDTAAQDFTQALAKALRLSALLTAQQKFNTSAIEPLFNQHADGNDSASGPRGSADAGGTVHGLLNDTGL